MGALESSLQNVLWYPPFFSQTKPTSSWWSSNCSSRNGASPLVTKQWGGWRKSPGERNRQTWWVCQYLTSGLSVAKAGHSAALPPWLSLFTKSPLKLVFGFLSQDTQPLEFSKPWDLMIPHSRWIFPQLVFGNQYRVCQAKHDLEVIE